MNSSTSKDDVPLLDEYPVTSSEQCKEEGEEEEVCRQLHAVDKDQQPFVFG